jgi:hypothetical protein
VSKERKQEWRRRRHTNRITRANGENRAKEGKNRTGSK